MTSRQPRVTQTMRIALLVKRHEATLAYGLASSSLIAVTYALMPPMVLGRAA